MADILHFPDRSLLKLIDAVNGVLDGSCEPTKALELAETVLQMAMLPNDYHPGPRCSCRECLLRYPDPPTGDT